MSLSSPLRYLLCVHWRNTAKARNWLDTTPGELSQQGERVLPWVPQTAVTGGSASPRARATSFSLLATNTHMGPRSHSLIALRMEALYFSLFILLILAQEELVPPAAHGMLAWVPESRWKPWLSSKQRTGSGEGGSWQPLQAQTSLSPLPSTLH